MRYLLILLILLMPKIARADAPVIWFGLWAKSLTSNGLEARGLKLDKDATATTPWTLVIPSPALVSNWTMTLPVDAGTANYVLKSDGLGVTSWANPTSLITGTANTFAGYTSLGALSSIPSWLWDNTTNGANVQIVTVPVTGEGSPTLHTFRQSLDPIANVTGSSWSTEQIELNVGTDDSGFSYSADGSGGPIGLSVNVNARNKSSVGNIRTIQTASQIGNGVDAVSSNNYNGIYSNINVTDAGTMNNQTESFTADVGVAATGTINNYTWGRGNLNSVGTITYLNGLNLGGNISTLSQYLNGISLNYNFVNSNGINGFNSNISVSGTNTNGYQPFAAFGTLANSNGITTFGDNLNVTNEATGFTSFRANPTITAAGSYSALSAAPNITAVDNVIMIDTAGNGTVDNWTDVNLHPNLTLVTDGYKGINATPVAVGDGSGYATVGYFDASQLTNFSAGQVLALQTQGNAQINGTLNAFAPITPIDLGGNPNAVHSAVSGITTAASTTTANVDTIGFNSAALMTISTNSINTSGPFGLGLAALALPAVLKTETGSSIDYVNGGVFAISLDATSSGGTVDELNSGRFVAIPQGGTTTINKLHLVKADLPFGDPATQSWGFYGSSTTSENWFAKNIKIGGTAGSTDIVTDAGSKLQIDGGAVDILTGQVKNSTTNGPIYLTPSGSGDILAGAPTALADTYFRVDGTTHNTHIGVSDDTGAASFDNVLALHGRTLGTQSKYIGLKAPDSVTTTTTFTLPNGDGTSGQVLSTNGSATLGWSSAATVPGTAGGVYSDGSALQSVAFTGNANKVFGVNSAATSMEAKDLVTGTTGTDFGIAHTAGTVTFNLPDASASARGAVTTGSQTFAGTKTFSGAILTSDGTVGAPSVAFSSDADGTGTGLYRVAANSLGFAANGVKVGEYSSAGAFTLGQTSFAGTHTLNANQVSLEAPATGGGLNYNANGQSWQIGNIGSTSGAPGGTNSMFFYDATGAKYVGGIGTNGSWTLGTSSVDVTHIIANNSIINDTLNLRNYDTSTSSDDNAPLSIIKGSTTNNTGQVFIHFTNSAGATGNGQINGNGVNAAAFGSFSDARLKKNIEDLPSQLGNILALRPVEFDYIKGGHQTGFIAQEMEKVYPDAVSTGKDDMLMITGWDKTDARLVKAIQELKAELDAAKEEIRNLKKAG